MSNMKAVLPPISSEGITYRSPRITGQHHEIAKISFGTKAETLERLQSRVDSARVLPQLRFTVDEWNSAPETVCHMVAAQGWTNCPVIVRSSALSEDSATQSLAGRFTSVANVLGKEQLHRAIAEVVDSFGHAASGDQFFIQPMIDRPTTRGVLFTRDPATGAQYLIINYDDLGDTAAVTSGNGASLHMVVHVKGSPSADPMVQRLASLSEELERLLSHSALDIEFAFNHAGELYLLQVRPLVLGIEHEIKVADHHRRLHCIRDRIAASMQSHPHLLGARTVFGVMPDWNPAEIIGVRPRPLAFSLYRHLITDDVWAKQRVAYGYRDVSGVPLLHSFNGLPYVDVRASFNSFLPADLSPDLGQKLIDYYVSCLAERPSLHDKVEFDIVFTCYTFDLADRVGALQSAGFTNAECVQIVDSLRRLTNKVIANDGLWNIDAAKVKELERRRQSGLKSNLRLVDKIYWLVEDCRHFGTLPFAGLARSGFIAVQLLRSLVSEQVLTPADFDSFMASIDTVSTRMAHDFAVMDRGDFLTRYGHLRPGTYDILAPRYDETPDEYFDWTNRNTYDDKTTFRLSLEQIEQVSDHLVKHGLNQDVLGLFKFIQAGIQGREYAKFIFTRNLSDALKLLTELGEQYGFSRDEMSFFDIRRIADIHSSGGDVRECLHDSIVAGRARYAETLQTTLPPLICAPDDVWSFALPSNEPNFITRKRAVGTVCSHHERDSLEGAIVAIPSADPGFDWIFSRKIAGFITAFGGANSHMAIRANELGVPAVIGTGELLYRHWSSARKLSIDCASQLVEIL